MKPRKYKKEITNANQKWSFSVLVAQPLIHAAAAYVLYLLVRAAMPQLYTGAWVLLGAFVVTLVLGISILTVTNNLHARGRNKAVDGVYIYKKIPRPLEYTDIAGLLSLTIGLLGSLSVIIVFGFSAFSTAMWILAGIFFVVSGLGITIGYHRYATHDSFDCGKLFGRLMLFCGAMAFQGEVVSTDSKGNITGGWAIDHQIHHARTEIEQEDPHTPHEGFWHSHMGWLIRPYVYSKEVIEEYSKKIKNSDLLIEQKKYFSHAATLGIAGPFLIFGILGLLSGEGFAYAFREGVMALLLAGLFRLTLVYNITWSVNSVSHTWGPHSYEGKATGDSTDVWMLAPISFGENLQNIHHLLPNFACYWIKWYYIDISGALLILFGQLSRLKFLSWVGFPYNLRLIGPRQREIILRSTV